MKRTKGWMVFVVALMISSAVSAREWWENFYVGVDAQMRRMTFKGGYGNNLLEHTAPQGNIYVGLKFNDCVAIEYGYEGTITRTRTVTLTTGEIAAGAPILSESSPTVFKSKARIKGPHLDLVGFYYFYENSPVQLLGSIGIAVIKGTFERRTVQISNLPRSMVRTLSDHKAVWRLMGGLQWMFDQNLGARATIGLVNTGRMVVFANDGLPGAFLPEIKPKNSTVYGLGMLWAF